MHCTLPSPCGQLRITAHEDAIIRIEFMDKPERHRPAVTPLLTKTCDQRQPIFAGNCIGFPFPCLRVIGANGRLIGYTDGLGRKDWLLRPRVGVEHLRAFADE